MNKSKLTDKQWDEIEARVAKGESRVQVGKDYGITESTIRSHFPTKSKTVKAVAKQLADAEQAFAKLPPRHREVARTLADELRDVSTHLVAAAKYGAATAHRLNGIAQGQTELIDDGNLDKSIKTLQNIAVLNKMAESAASIGLKLIAANREPERPTVEAADSLRLLVERLPD